MKCRSSFRLILGFTAILSVLLSPTLFADDLKSRVQEATCDFKDVTITCKVLQANMKALKKISKDFSKQYEMKTSTVRYKAPDMLKMESKLGMVKVSIVINGNEKAILIPAIHYVNRQNIKDDPHKRQTDFDLGILSTSLWRDYKVHEICKDKGDYKIYFTRPVDRRKMLCWVDSDTLKLLRVEKYEEDGGLKVRYNYTGHRLIGGKIWIPSRVEVYNGDGELAGTSVYENIRVNTGIPDSEFRT